MKSPSMPFFGRDFYGSTFVKLLPRGVRADYLELLWHQWDNGSLPESPGKLRGMLGVSPKAWATTWEMLESKFPVVGDGTRLNPRLETIRAARAALEEARSKAGASGNQKRWSPDRKPIANSSQDDRKPIANAIAKTSLAVAVEEAESKAFSPPLLEDPTAAAPVPDRGDGPNPGPPPGENPLAQDHGKPPTLTGPGAFAMPPAWVPVDARVGRQRADVQLARLKSHLASGAAE